MESEGRDERNRAEFRFCETLRRRILHRILFRTYSIVALDGSFAYSFTLQKRSAWSPWWRIFMDISSLTMHPAK